MTDKKQVAKAWTKAEREEALFPESSDIARLRRRAQADAVPVVSKSLGAFLQALVRLKDPQRFLEVGAGYGLASILMGLASPRLEGVSVEIHPTRYETSSSHLQTFGLNRRIQVLRGDIRQASDRAKIPGTFDLILIDAAKGQYTRLLEDLEPFLRPGGIFLFTDIYLRGRLASGQIDRHREKTSLLRMRRFIDSSLYHPCYDVYVLDIDDGLLMLCRKEAGHG